MSRPYPGETQRTDAAADTELHAPASGSERRAGRSIHSAADDSALGSVDQVFIWLSEVRGAAAPVAVQTVAARKPPAEEASPPPPEASRAETEWLREERERFRAFTADQLAALNRQRQELAAVQSRAERQLVSREQELNRRQALLDARLQALQEREQAAECREAELAARADAQVAREASAAGLGEEFRRLAEAVAREEVLLTGLKEEADRLRPALHQARAEYERMRESVRAFEQERSRWEAQREQCLRRLDDVDQAEQALLRRAAEVERMEEEVRTELDRRDCELRRRERELEARAKHAGRAERVGAP